MYQNEFETLSDITLIYHCDKSLFVNFKKVLPVVMPSYKFICSIHQAESVSIIFMHMHNHQVIKLLL